MTAPRRAVKGDGGGRPDEVPRAVCCVDFIVRRSEALGRQVRWSGRRFRIEMLRLWQADGNLEVSHVNCVDGSSGVERWQEGVILLGNRCVGESGKVGRRVRLGDGPLDASRRRNSTINVTESRKRHKSLTARERGTSSPPMPPDRPASHELERRPKASRSPARLG